MRPSPAPTHLAAWLAVCCLAWSGCTAPARSGEQPATRPAAVNPADQIDAVSLLAMPTAVNLDDIPGPDGVQVQLYLFRLDQPLSVVLASGTVEFFLYEGKVPKTQLQERAPFHTWSFTPAQLAPSAAHDVVGWAYGLTLNWGEHPPRTRTVTLVARYRPPAGPPVYSTPTLLAVGQMG